jgi:phenylacetic acid degradation operon negative regulatory protein
VTANGARPLTARSVLASTLLGTEPPRLPVAFLVRTGELFGFAEGTVRTALSRMAASGEVVPEGDGHYALGEQLLVRQRRQLTSRAAVTAAWSGRWWMGVVTPGGRAPSERHELRAAMGRARFAELRDGVWLRPDNLDELDRPGDPGAVTWFSSRPDREPAALAASLWDLEGWAQRARALRAELVATRRRLEQGELDALAPGFVLSASVLRHFLADPLLPDELLGDDWPGPELRDHYDEYDEVYRRLLASWAAGTTANAPAGTVDTRD